MSSRQTVPPQDANPKHSAQTRPVNPTQRSLPIRIYPHGLLLLSPLLFVVTGAILLGLLRVEPLGDVEGTQRVLLPLHLTEDNGQLSVDA